MGSPVHSTCQCRAGCFLWQGTRFPLWDKSECCKGNQGVAGFPRPHCKWESELSRTVQNVTGLGGRTLRLRTNCAASTGGTARPTEPPGARWSPLTLSAAQAS